MKGTCAFLHYTHTDFVLQNIRLFQLWLCNFTVVEWILVIVEQFKGSMKEPNKFHNYETEKITRKASDAAEYIELFGFPPEIVMYDTFYVILWMSADICVVMHDDFGWKNRCNCRFSAASVTLQVIFFRRKRPLIYASCMTISGWRTEQHVVIGFGELATVD